MAKDLKHVKAWAFHVGELHGRIKKYSKTAEGRAVFGLIRDNLVVLGGTVTVKGPTPKIIIGDGDEEDTMLCFDGNALDYRIGLDDGTDKLEIGKGCTHGTTTAITIDTNQQVSFEATTASTSTSTPEALFLREESVLLMTSWSVITSLLTQIQRLSL